MRSVFKRLFARWQRPAHPLSDIERARQLIAAIDRGGIPLDPARIRHIAEGLGLEVSRKAPAAETIERIRAALGRCPPG